ncbi:MAG: protein kinase domain-containing protein [Ktedonobacterales bacterium]
MNDALQDLRGLQLAERYQLDEIVAQGSLCAVYRGQDTVLHRPIAIKAIEPGMVATYRAALQATSTLSHPAIVATYDAIEHDGWLFLIQEYLQARPLTGYLRAGVPSERAVDLGGQIARVLAYAHAHDVTHGDLTPSAILIDRRAIVRVNNFGLPHDTHYFATLDNALEVAQTEDATLHAKLSDATPAGDVRALGLLLWQLLRTQRDATEAAFRDDVHVGLQNLVRRCVLRSHSQRITDAGTLVLELEALARTLAAARPALSEDTPAALRAARQAVEREAAWSVQSTQGTSRRWSPPPTDPLTYESTAPWSYDGATPLITGAPRLTLPSRPADEGEARRIVRTDPMPWSGSLPPQHDDAPTKPSVRNHMSFGLILALCLLLFALFFIFGYLAPPLLGQP